MKFRRINGMGYAAIRAKHKLSQQQLADQLGISRTTIAMVEAGLRRLPAAALLRLAEMEIKKAAMESNSVTTGGENNIDLR